MRKVGKLEWLEIQIEKPSKSLKQLWDFIPIWSSEIFFSGNLFRLYLTSIVRLEKCYVISYWFRIKRSLLPYYRTHIELYTYLICVFLSRKPSGEKSNFSPITEMCQIKFMSCYRKACWRRELEIGMKNWLVYYWSLPSCTDTDTI